MNRLARMMLVTLSAFLVLALAAGAPARAQDGHDAPAHAEDAVNTAADHAPDPHAAAAGDHGDGHGDAEHSGVIPTIPQGVPAAVTALLAFFIVVAVMYVAIWPKITKGLDERAKKITDEIAAAERARKQAADALDEYEKNLAEARAEAKQMLEQTKAEQAELAAQLKAKADRELTELRDRARQDIEAAKRAAVNEIYAESVSLASNIAGKILQREVSAGDQQRLVEESLAEMKASN